MLESAADANDGGAADIVDQDHHIQAPDPAVVAVAEAEATQATSTTVVEEEACALVKSRVETALQVAFQEEANSSTPAPALTQAEETAVLVGERVALRELVERQHERIRSLEGELRESKTAQESGLLGNALSMYQQSISDAHDALSTGVKHVTKELTKEKRGA